MQSCSKTFQRENESFCVLHWGKGGDAAIMELHPASLLILSKTHCTTRITCVLGATKCPLEQSDHFQAVRAISKRQGEQTHLPSAPLICFRCQNPRQDQERATGSRGCSERTCLAYIDTYQWAIYSSRKHSWVNLLTWLQGGSCPFILLIWCFSNYTRTIPFVKFLLCAHRWRMFYFQRHQGKEFY